ncbi:class C beta-lactamase [Leptolyngbya sp. FACHB-261]|uniref:class C beta-lactamase n=1 Tax=Leptolyngbya sp. FACHB-261 TaxID=2692806 RepID=UPI0016869A07|nr:class C beta-lactamase [Leptolyngbya sp. FACHB-261]MBD2099764.1 beta-lactamase [Leptolyngbya sp. FACHB-261]
MKISVLKVGIIAAISFFLGACAHATDSGDQSQLEQVVSEAIRPLMDENNVPGMVVAVTVEGKRYFFNYGVASKESGQKVTENTIFEIGSISKTFTATLASYAQVSGTLSLSDHASKYLPALTGSSFDQISLLDLGTYTAGGLPLQFPDDVSDQEGMIAYYKGWRPSYTPGTHRLYSNPSIGLFGYLAAKSMGEPFDDLMEKKLFPRLGLTHTYLRVPQDQMGQYAYGYSKDNKPTRVTPGVLDSEAYGVKTTASDMIQFVEANMNGTDLDATLQRAIAGTHTGYFKVSDMTQGLGWEMYAYPINLEQLLAGNSPQVIFKANEVTRLAPPLSPQENVLINKTGSTNGFGAYVAFVPTKGIGIVIMANKNYPIPARVKAAYQILIALDR